MRWLICMCLLKCDHSFLLRLPNIYGNKHEIFTITNSFETLKNIPQIKSITVGKSTRKNDPEVFVSAFVVREDGGETFIKSSGDGLLRACENCVNDAFIEMCILSQTKNVSCV